MIYRSPEMEDVDSISVAVAGIDIDTVEALENRTMVGFINTFICDTASFLNHFAGECERRLQKVQEKIIRMDANLRILEAKLASIPPLVASTGVVVPSSQPTSISTTSASDSKSSEPKIAPNIRETETPSSSSSAPTNETDSNISDAEKDSSERRNVEDETSGASNSHPKDDPIYAKYFKMVAVGVPIPAVKLKMSSEGLDPSVLDTK